MTTQKTTEELWEYIGQMAQSLRKKNSPASKMRIEEEEIANRCLEVLKVQARRGEKLQLNKIKQICDMDSFMDSLKKEFRQLAERESRAKNGNKSLEKFAFHKAVGVQVDDLNNPDMWQKLWKIKDKIEIEDIKKPKIGRAVYVLGDVNEKTGKWENTEKIRCEFPADLSEKETQKVLAVKIKNVSVIKEDSFADYKNLRKIELADGVKEIEDFAFLKCENLEKVYLGNNVKKIGRGAFMQCKKLQKVELGNSVEKIGKECFFGTAIKKIDLPLNVKKLGKEAFGRCDNLKTITVRTLDIVNPQDIPENVEVIWKKVEETVLSPKDLASLDKKRKLTASELQEISLVDEKVLQRED